MTIPLENPGPLQNKVFPDGSIRAVKMRGLFMGNRGILHNHEMKTLHPVTRWTHKAWISCLVEFKGRKRTLMDKRKYTELFFLDEVTALAAGHRPCYECRRDAAKAFSGAWQAGLKINAPPRAGDMDTILHGERKRGRKKCLHPRRWADLPDGSMVVDGERFIAKHQGRALIWTPLGYEVAEGTFALTANTECQALTPPSIIATLQAGYSPQWHSSAQLPLEAQAL